MTVRLYHFGSHRLVPEGKVETEEEAKKMISIFSGMFIGEFSDADKLERKLDEPAFEPAWGMYVDGERVEREQALKHLQSED